MKLIKLIASDIDGTLLRDGAREIPPGIFAQIRRLREKGVAFCAASGRQYASLRKLFAPVADDIFYVCENGNIVFREGEPIFKQAFDRRDAMELIGEIQAQPQCEVMISGAGTSYLMPKHADYAGLIRDFVSNHITLVEKPQDIQEEILKISAYCRDGAVRYEPTLGARWRGRAQVAVAGREWLDFTMADKGKGLAALCDSLGVAAQDVMAFGDNYNDLPMLRMVGTPYLMTGSMTPQQAGFPVRTADCVEQVLRQL